MPSLRGAGGASGTQARGLRLCPRFHGGSGRSYVIYLFFSLSLSKRFSTYYGNLCPLLGLKGLFLPQVPALGR